MAFPTTGILDNFDRANEGPPPSADWTDIQNGLKVVDNEVIGDAAATNYNWSGYETQYGPNCEAYFTLTDIVTTGGEGVFARLTTLVLATVDGYAAWYDSASGLKLYRVDDGGFTQLGDTVAFAGANGDKIGIEIIGTTIKCYVDDGGAGWVEMDSEVEGTYTSAGYLGIRIYGSGDEGDDFGGGTIAAPPPEGQPSIRRLGGINHSIGHNLQGFRRW